MAAALYCLHSLCQRTAPKKTRSPTTRRREGVHRQGQQGRPRAGGLRAAGRGAVGQPQGRRAHLEAPAPPARGGWRVMAAKFVGDVVQCVKHALTSPFTAQA